MNTKFFFSAIAMFAITTVANAAAVKSDVVRVNEEVATSAVIRRAEAVRVNEEVATSAVVKGVESKSGMELAARRGPHFPPYIVDTEKPMEVAIFGSGIKRVSDTEKPMEVAIYNPLRH